MTDKIEEEAEKYFQKILRMGNGSFYDGVVEGINNGFFRREIARASYEFQSRVEKGERIIVGVNAFQDEQGGSFEYEKFKLHSSVQDEQKNFLKLIKSKRDWGSVKKSLDELSSAVRRGDNLVPYIKEAVKNFATEEEIMNTLKEIYGEYLDLKTL